MMMCVRCHKRPATVFVSQSRDSKQIQGYCFVCARELGIQPVNDMMDNMMNSLKQQTGMSDEELKEATEQMAQMMGLSLPEEDSGDDLFTPGGAATLPVDQMLGGKPGENGGYGSSVRDRKEAPPKKKRKHIQNFCTDLTEKARNGELDNIIGREKEIQRVVQILSRRTKNNPCLIG
ncbi:MAG TPA: ATP-dependent Clp protease ATP-binding subunit, partial [Candidatus Acutalibacter pullistercoris]|nr:ATP-dependent Clp protease ATP-binding subunit [Candidatus Acutalibacter pullistercoris]